MEAKRKGARSIKDIPNEILAQLNKGEIETANLVEWLAVNQKVLLNNVLLQHNRAKYIKPIIEQVDNLKKLTVNTINEAIGTGLFEQAISHKDEEFVVKMSTHKSDIVRCWATYSIGNNSGLSINDSLKLIQPFAADKHFGVREISWLAVRSKITENLESSIEVLEKWAKSKDENIRRFASEATRPRGVWCGHIEVLKKNPSIGLPILNGLKADTSKYVQDSVGNWLNDASKTQPEFVQKLCKKWGKESDTKETNYIIKKALRTINK